MSIAGLNEAAIKDKSKPSVCFPLEGDTSERSKGVLDLSSLLFLLVGVSMIRLSVEIILLVFNCISI